jgi:hypothetical protein
VSTVYIIKNESGDLFYVELENGVVTDCPMAIAWMVGLTTNRMVNACKEKGWECEWLSPYARELQDAAAKRDSVNHPDHYNLHPSGIECIEIVRHMNFNLGNAMKYIWRCGLKDNITDLEDLKKARWYLDDEIRRLQGISHDNTK